MVRGRALLLVLLVATAVVVGAVAATGTAAFGGSTGGPQNVRIQMASADALRLMWSPGGRADRAAGYQVSLNGRVAGTTPLLSWTFRGLACGTSYALAVASTTSADSPITVIGTTLPCPAPAPTTTSAPPPVVSPIPVASGTVTPSSPVTPLPSTSANPASGGSSITTHSFWDCTAPVASYGALPLTVHVIVPNTSTFGAALDSGCTGDGNPNTVDLILDVQGNGADIGPNDDALKVRGAASLEVSGHVDCGARAAGAHQDGVQVQRGHDVTFEGLTTGSRADGSWTCNGSGGAFFVSAVGGDSEVTNVVCDGCQMVTANQGLGINSGVASGARNSYFRSVRATPCRVVGGIGPVNENNTCIQG